MNTLFLQGKDQKYIRDGSLCWFMKMPTICQEINDIKIPKSKLEAYNQGKTLTHNQFVRSTRSVKWMT